MNLRKLKLPTLRVMLVWIRSRLVHRLRVGWRTAFLDPTPAWKKNGVVHGLSGFFDLALLLAVVCLALINWLW